MSATKVEVLRRIVRGELLDGDVKEISSIFRDKTTTQKNAFLNKLGIEVINDKNPTPKISTEKISDLALHSVTQELLIQQASEQTGQNTFLRTDYGYLGLNKKLLAEEGRRHPLEEGGKVLDVIVDHLRAILKVAPKVLNSEKSIDIEDLAMKLEPSYTLDLSALRKDLSPEPVALEVIEGLAATLEPELIAAPVAVYVPPLRASFSQKIIENFFGVKSVINKLAGAFESFIYDKLTSSINLFGEGIKAASLNVDHQDLVVEVDGEGAYHSEI